MISPTVPTSSIPRPSRVDTTIVPFDRHSIGLSSTRRANRNSATPPPTHTTSNPSHRRPRTAQYLKSCTRSASRRRGDVDNGKPGHLPGGTPPEHRPEQGYGVNAWSEP